MHKIIVGFFDKKSFWSSFSMLNFESCAIQHVTGKIAITSLGVRNAKKVPIKKLV